MERIDKIEKHPMYIRYLKAIEDTEEGRIFCRHGAEHALDVARIMYIMALENGGGIEKDVIYAAALLHDIGRGMQYEENVPHHEAGVKLSGQILKDCGYNDIEIDDITEAIEAHGEKTLSDSFTLKELLYEADKKSRMCYRCKAGDKCYWEQDKRNGNIIY